MTTPQVSYNIVSYNRKDDLRKAIISILAQIYEPMEIVVVDNNSQDGTEDLFEGEFDNGVVRFVKLRANLGVCGGRNVAVTHSCGEIIITIDDDAELLSPEATRLVVERFASEPDVGILAFKILDPATHAIQKYCSPVRDRRFNPDTERDVSMFIGAGHAVRREVYQQVGPYPDYFPWGSEEMHLSVRAIDAGYRILYFPAVEVLHRRAQEGRLLGVEFRAVALENRIKVAVRNLPWRYVFTTAAVHTLAHLFLLTRLNVTGIFLAYRRLFAKRKSLLAERSVLSPETIAQLKRLKAPLLY